MPVSRKQKSDDIAPALRPYTHHGIDLSIKGNHGVGDCPFCMGEGKFSADAESGLWRCWVCGGGTDSGGGNALQFVRLLHATAVADTPPAFHSEVALDRRLCSAATVAAWGVCRSSIPPYPWLIPGYAPDGRLDQLYKRAYVDGAWRLLPTPSLWGEGKQHALHLPVGDYDQRRSTIYVCEGPWDAMALWEVHGSSSDDNNIIAVPGCNVWRDEWSTMCKGKSVILMYDSDHPRLHGTQTFIAGYDGMCRVTKRLSGIASQRMWIRWGLDGWDATRPNGWDVRDELSGVPGKPLFLADRQPKLLELLGKVEYIPTDLSGPSVITSSRLHNNIEPHECQTWQACVAGWKIAMQWRSDMDDALSVSLAVCASTQQAGNQLFLDIVGSPGSGKTTICDGLLVSRHCHHLEHLTGFHSGWKKPESETSNGEKKDCSLIARINGKTLVTPEFDIMRSSPRYTELMGQTRRIFDGKSGATYKNSDEDTLYVGLRTPWIRAGTPSSIMDADQSQLGDRFLRVIINDPSTDEEKREIMRSALRSERTAMLGTANGTAGSILDGKTCKAHALTGGYVDWLRANVEEQIVVIHSNTDVDVEEKILDLADLSAEMRARPNDDKRKKEQHDCKELPTRLARQFMRLAEHLAVVLNKQSADEEVIRIVRKVALDTAYGHTLNITRWLLTTNHRSPGRTYQACGGLSAKVLETWTGMAEERLLSYLLFLRKIGVVQLNRLSSGIETWILTDRIQDLYSRVMEG